MSLDLKPCPFCGCTLVLIHDKYRYNAVKRIFYVVCNECGAGSGECSTDVEASEAWNQRVNDIKLAEGQTK